ncbi:hypothetical protein Zmor_001632 [Zophobas morio]|uniref:Uncharacterized protein n=1 Tax=Zophobas morio TaxID=2755281 RepID=A0AA38J9K4_9CUCU|nr:hypothetical protein Zmor_001632 [Zophobas morio]
MQQGITSPFDAGFFFFFFRRIPVVVTFKSLRDTLVARNPGKTQAAPDRTRRDGGPEPSPRQGRVSRSPEIGTNSGSRGGVCTGRPGELREGFRVGGLFKPSPVTNTLESPPFQPSR